MRRPARKPQKNWHGIAEMFAELGGTQHLLAKNRNPKPPEPAQLDLPKQDEVKKGRG